MAQPKPDGIKAHPLTARQQHWPAIALILAAVLGMGLRLLAYLSRPSLWDDEIFLSLNVITRSFSGLLSKLDFEQFAPPGFVWLQRLSIDVAGVSETSLRFIPFITGCIAIFLVWDTGLKLFNPRVACLAGALIAFSPYAVRYSNEAKQYGFEAFVAAALIWMAARWSTLLAHNAVAGSILICGLISLISSTSAIFVLCGVWLYYTLELTQRPAARRDLALLAGGSLIWSAAFLTLYILVLTRQVDEYLFRYWHPIRIEEQPGIVPALNLVMRAYFEPLLSLDSTMPMALYGAGVCLTLAGILSLRGSKNVRVLALLVVPLFLVFVAGLIGKWYFTARLMLFTMPLIALLLAAGAERVVNWLVSGRRETLFAALAFAILCFPLKGALYTARRPEVEDLRQAVQFCFSQSQPGDSIFVLARSMPGWIYYSMDWEKPDMSRYRWLQTASRRTGPNAGNIQSRPQRIHREGFDLLRPYRDGWELVGIGEGTFRSIAGVPLNRGADAGWAENEASRIQNIKSSRIIVLASVSSEHIVLELLRELLRSGAQQRNVYRGKGSFAFVLERPEPKN